MSKFGIIAAMDSEARILRENMVGLKTETIAKTVFYCGKIGEHDVVLMQCGIGKVCAACATQALISRFSPDYIINTGCAGALSPALKVGDMVISRSAVEYDLDFTEIGFPLGFIT
ncbi:MAG: 5'-methylthioadenosine/S-adenosylhomocysteine nucleosidase, partial [Bacteroidales bacterium]|nr:5'-methylthioadenosine/S-adenosylhomocysteine nucleosidase [Bacteroidales bacterium]